MSAIGFPKMHKEKNEKRDFLPDFFKKINSDKVEFYLEKNYGSALGFCESDYLLSNPNIKFVDNKKCYENDVVVVLRAPEYNEIEYMKAGSTLVSMLHYDTRLKRRALLKKKNITSISLDSLKNDLNERIVVNYEGTAGYGINIAFDELTKAMKNYYEKDREIINVTIIGMGMVGYKAAQAARIYGSNELNNKMKLTNAKGVLIKMIPKNITCDNSEMKKILADTDILVDASTRENVSEYIIHNSHLAWLKPTSIILDLTADPYLTDINPIQVKAIEGIPTGTLDKYVFYPDDSAYDALPKDVCSANRRTVVSCNAWPGVNPLDCMEVYGKQLHPIIKKILTNDIKSFSLEDEDFYTRAIYRASLDYYDKLKAGTLLLK
jgi:alanine dehydrogenase